MEETVYPNLFIFKFFHDLDVERVLDDGPWTFNQHVLLLKKLDMSEQLKDITLSDLFIWLQIYDLPIGFNSEYILKSIGNYVGKFMEADPRNFQGLMGNYLRVKVAVDVRRPLKSHMKIKKAGGDWMWIQFNYERLPSFCFYCGIIIHSHKFCEALFDNPEAGEERRNDSSLRAMIRRRNNSKENQWIRDANGSLVNYSRSGGNGEFPMGEREDDWLKSNSRDFRMVQRENSNQVSTTDIIASHRLELNKENLNLEDNIPHNEGIVLSKQKRSRIELTGETKLGLKSNVHDGLDIVMTEIKVLKNQKNLALVGPVLQARPPQ